MLAIFLKNRVVVPNLAPAAKEIDANIPTIPKIRYGNSNVICISANEYNYPTAMYETKSPEM